MTYRDLQREGFTRIAGIGELRARQTWRDLPGEPGVYAVIWPVEQQPLFLDENMGHPATTAKCEILERAWVPDSDILYIGSTIRPLRRRIRELIRHGLGKMDNHSGGEWMWQVEGIEAASLVACGSDEPVKLEGELLDGFRREHGGRLPFANRQDAP